MVLMLLYYVFNFRKSLIASCFLCNMPVKAQRSDVKMPICAICGEEADNVTKCKMCGEKFCVDCGEPDEKLCIYCLDNEEELEKDEDLGKDEDWDDE